jgi:anti-sigma factor RsiW
MTTKISPRDWEAISAYVDGQLTPKERARLEDRLRANTELRAALQEIRRTRAMLRSQPRLRAPRNFTLTPEMVGQQSAVRRPAPRLYPAMRLASALASLLFVLVLLGDLLLVGAGGPAAPVAMQEPAAVMEAPAPADEDAAILAAPESAGSSEPAAGDALPTYSPEEIQAMTAAPPGAGMGKFAAETPTPIVGEAERALAPEPTRPAANTELPEEPAQDGPSEAMEMSVAPTSTGVPTPLAYASPQGELEEELPQVEIQEAPVEVQPDEGVPPVEEPAAAAPWRVAEISLGLVALITGLAALYLRFVRRS